MSSIFAPFFPISRQLKLPSFLFLLLGEERKKEVGKEDVSIAEKGIEVCGQKRRQQKA
jgi:hypothetical protein